MTPEHDSFALTRTIEVRNRLPDRLETVRKETAT